jgi:hypothetical protein
MWFNRFFQVESTRHALTRRDRQLSGPRLDRLRPLEVVSLEALASLAAQKIQLGHVLHAFGHHLEMQVARTDRMVSTRATSLMSCGTSCTKLLSTFSSAKGRRLRYISEE